jgi:hypothetical protein
VCATVLVCARINRLYGNVTYTPLCSAYKIKLVGHNIFLLLRMLIMLLVLLYIIVNTIILQPADDGVGAATCSSLFSKTLCSTDTCFRD